MIVESNFNNRTHDTWTWFSNQVFKWLLSISHTRQFIFHLWFECMNFSNLSFCLFFRAPASALSTQIWHHVCVPDWLPTSIRLWGSRSLYYYFIICVCWFRILFWLNLPWNHYRYMSVPMSRSTFNLNLEVKGECELEFRITPKCCWEGVKFSFSFLLFNLNLNLNLNLDLNLNLNLNLNLKLNLNLDLNPVFVGFWPTRNLVGFWREFAQGEIINEILARACPPTRPANFTLKIQI